MKENIWTFRLMLFAVPFSQWCSSMQRPLWCYLVISLLGHPGWSPTISSSRLPRCECLNIIFSQLMFAIVHSYMRMTLLQTLHFRLSRHLIWNLGTWNALCAEEMLQTIYFLHPLKKCYMYHYPAMHDVTFPETLFTPWTLPRMLYVSFSLFPNFRTALCLWAHYL
jgi:hypothetical protein